jgi:hypothetical protein
MVIRDLVSLMDPYSQMPWVRAYPIRPKLEVLMDVGIRQGRPAALVSRIARQVAVALPFILWSADVRAEIAEPFACHPAYEAPCVPVGPDHLPPCDRVPDFAFPVGEDDPLDLDHDDDGLGCEGIQETIWGDDLCEIAICR